MFYEWIWHVNLVHALWIFSFMKVPLETSMSDIHPLSACFLRFLIRFLLSSGRYDFQVSSRLSRFLTITSFDAVARFLFSDLSPSCLTKNFASLQNLMWFNRSISRFQTDEVKRCMAWNKSSVTSQSFPKLFSIWWDTAISKPLNR